MTYRTIDRLLFCLSNSLIYIACLHDLFIVKYRSDNSVLPRSILLVVFSLHLLLFFFIRISPTIFSNLFQWTSSFFLATALSLSILTPLTSPISSTSHFFLFNFLLFFAILSSFLGNAIHLLRPTPFHFLHSHEFAEFLGYALGIGISGQSSALFWFLLSFFLLVLTIRLRAFHSFILLALNLIHFYYYFTPYSYIACLCLLVRLFARPIIELYFVSLTSMERWLLLLQLSKPYRKPFQRFSILIYFLLPLRCISVIGETVRNHDQWFIIIPIFLLCFSLWLLFRSLACSLLWMLSNKLIDCYLTMIQSNLDKDQQQISLIKLMASKGIRYFGLITWPILVCSTFFTLFLGLLHSDTCTQDSLVLLLFTVNFEFLLLALVKQFTSIVGGSCIAYALVAPAFE